MSDLIQSKELAKIFNISNATLYRILRSGPREVRSSAKRISIETLGCVMVGGKRFWSRKEAEALLASSIG